MAQPHPQPTQQRPQFPTHSQSFPNVYPPHQNGRPQGISPQSPNMSFNSPSPQSAFSPTYTSQAPPAKRPRLSSESPSSFQQPVGTPTPSAMSPPIPQPNGLQHQSSLQPQRVNSMPPPQRPPEKEDQNYNDVFKGTGIDLEREASFNTGFFSSSQGPTGSASFNSATGQLPGQPNLQTPALSSHTPQEIAERKAQRQDWDASRHSQHELWDPFIYGGTLNDKLKSMSHKVGLQDPQSGVLVNTLKDRPPPMVRVDGLEGASRVINGGQSILDNKEKAERLNELVKLISLSAKARLTGIIQTSARLALERRDHSKGRIPSDWADLAIQPKTAEGADQASTSPTATGMKRSASQMSSGPDRAQPMIDENIVKMQKLADSTLKSEEERRKRRERRTAKASAAENEAAASADAEALAAMDERKTTKKERKAAESRVSEQQQHANTNDAARMATASLFGKKSKQYSWMTKGGGTSTPSKAPSSAVTTPSRNAGTPVPTPQTQKANEARRGPRLGDFDESAETGIQLRDVLLVLESDGRAARTYVKGVSVLDDPKLPSS